jgi:hypothetical protein
MARDRSLDEFAVDEASGSDEPDVGRDPPDEEGGDVSGDTDTDSMEATDAGPTDATDADAPEATDTNSTEATDADTPDDVDPATATYRWEPGGIECPECGQVVERLWSQDDAHICVNCKEW